MAIKKNNNSVVHSSASACKGVPVRSRSFLLSAAIAALFCSAGGVRTASAQSVVGGGDLILAPGSVQTPGSWTIGPTGTDELDVGDSAAGSLAISAGGTVTNGDSYIGGAASGVGTVTVSGSDGAGNASTWSNSGQVNLGNDGDGAVQVDNGGAANAGLTVVGVGGGVGLLTVSGHDAFGHASMWASSSSIYIGDAGTGTLQVSDGGLVRGDADGIIGNQTGGIGHATVTGAGSAWRLATNIYVGFSGAGDLQVLDGATVSSSLIGGAAATVYLGYSTGGTGTITVSSSTADTSTLIVSDALRVGYVDTGTMTIGKGGLVRVGSDVHIADFGASTGTLHLDGDATGRGILETGSVIQGAGLATLDLNGGVLRATRDESSFLNGFTALTVGAEGAWFDSNGHDIAVDTAFTGSSSFNKLGLGTLTLSGNSAAFTGATTVQGGTLQVDGVLGGPTDVQAGGRLSGTGQVGPTTNSGVIAPGKPSAFGTLTIAGNYTPSGGGLAIRSVLGDDTSPTDLLAVTGATSGVTPLTVTNVGGTGAQTTQGIQVVRINGASNGQFNLANGNYVIGGQSALIAGAYGYVLQKDAADGGWYLRSSLLALGSPTPQGSPTPPGGAADGPLYQPGVPVYEAYANTLLDLSGVPTLQQRVGNRRYDAADRDHDGVWGRVEAKSSRLSPSLSTSGSSQNIDSWQAQFGVDRILFGEEDGARLVGGLTARYGTADTGVSSIYGDGDIDTKAYGVGATLTWYGQQGAYVDAQAQATLFRSDLSSRLAGSLANGQTGRGYAVSVEAGKAVPAGGGFSVIPQAQLSYVSSSFGFQDHFDAQVDSDKAESLQGRLGLALDYQRIGRNAAGQARRLNFYGVLNLKREFLDGTRVTVSGTAFDNRLGRTWTGLSVGGDYAWADRYAIYGEVGADSDLHGSYGISATAGFKMLF